MPEIELVESSSAGSQLNRLMLAVLALLYCLPAFAAEPLARIQTMEWSGDTGSHDSETTADASPDDVWQRIRNGFKIDEAASDNPLVATYVAWYTARPDNVRRMAERSRRYLFHIVQEVDRRSMPMEIALLPMIESAFNSSALSSSAASGIWQFMPATGRHYGLKQDYWYDGRRDFTASTHAALDYLGKLYLDFGDWQLALAAYNCGEGCVARAIQKNVDQGLPTDYASLSLPNETRHYVPKLLAIKNMIRNPAQFGVAINSLPNQPYFNQVTVHAGMDIHAAARFADMSSNDFIALNAAFPRNLIRSDSPVTLLVPVDKTDQFKRNLETKTWDSWQPFPAQKGDRLEAIAKRFKVTIERLKEYNLFNLKRGKLVQAQSIMVPVQGRGVVAPPKPMTDSGVEGSSHHKIGSGDTLFGVARRYGITASSLIQANPDLKGNLHVGQTLVLPLNEKAIPKHTAIQHVAISPNKIKPTQAVDYTVKRGDTLLSIAQRFDVSLADIKHWNPAFRKSSTIRPGQEIIVGKP